MLKLDATLPLNLSPSDLAAHARRLQDTGHGCIWVGETCFDPILQIQQALAATDRIRAGSCVVIAFARSPMTLATTAYELQRLSAGRFVLGIGSQIKAHIERRFSMPWSHPAARMREYVQALRAIWACWHDGAKLDFRGRFYTHTLMTPVFVPPRHEFGPPPVFVAAVGEKMIEAAAEVADGLHVHGFHSVDYLREVIKPLASAARARGEFAGRPLALHAPVFTAIYRNDEERAAELAAVRSSISFYASTPAYRAVLDQHGWGALQPELTALTKAGRWQDMPGLVDDAMVATLAVSGTPEEVGRELRRRYDGLVDSISSTSALYADPDICGRVIAAFNAAG